MRRFGSPLSRDTVLLWRQALAPLRVVELESPWRRWIIAFRVLDDVSPGDGSCIWRGQRRRRLGAFELGNEFFDVDAEVVVNHRATGIDKDEPGRAAVTVALHQHRTGAHATGAGVVAERYRQCVFALVRCHPIYGVGFEVLENRLHRREADEGRTAKSLDHTDQRRKAGQVAAWAGVLEAEDQLEFPAHLV